MSDVEVANNPARRRYEAMLDGEIVGIAQYVPADGRLIFTHTEVDSQLEGRGVGSALAAGALDDVRRSGLRATLHCPFMSAYARRHPEYEDIVDFRRQGGPRSDS